MGLRLHPQQSSRINLPGSTLGEACRGHAIIILLSTLQDRQRYSLLA